MTRRDTLTCIHEPFGDAFYFGPERLSERYENDEKAREESGFSQSTYKTIFERLEREAVEGKRLFIKDIIHYLCPPEGKPASIAPSLGGKTIKKGVGTNGMPGVSDNGTNGMNGTKGTIVVNGAAKTAAPYPYNTEAEPGNPTVVPLEILKQFHFTFLIRHPRHSTPSYYRCTIPPLDSVTGFYNFMSSEAGYDEERRVFDYLCAQKLIGTEDIKITVIDADDLLENPAGIVEEFCKQVGFEYTPDMLNWDTDIDHAQAKAAFEKWKGFHDDAIESKCLKAREHKTYIFEAEDVQWAKLYGKEGQRIIRECVEKNIADYEYLKQFATRV